MARYIIKNNELYEQHNMLPDTLEGNATMKKWVKGVDLPLITPVYRDGKKYNLLWSANSKLTRDRQKDHETHLHGDWSHYIRKGDQLYPTERHVRKLRSNDARGTCCENIGHYYAPRDLEPMGKKIVKKIESDPNYSIGLGEEREVLFHYLDWLKEKKHKTK
jgi:hypothetical protein